MYSPSSVGILLCLGTLATVAHLTKWREPGVAYGAEHLADVGVDGAPEGVGGI
jgi:hypothetical protein